jgi:hypothetical protein
LPAPTTIATSTPEARTAAISLRERLDHAGVDPVLASAHERLARELEQNAPEAGGTGFRRVDRLLRVQAHRPQPASEKR